MAGSTEIAQFALECSPVSFSHTIIITGQTLLHVVWMYVILCARTDLTTTLTTHEIETFVKRSRLQAGLVRHRKEPAPWPSSPAPAPPLPPKHIEKTRRRMQRTSPRQPAPPQAGPCRMGSQTLPTCLLVPHKPQTSSHASSCNLALGCVAPLQGGRGGRNNASGGHPVSGGAADVPRRSLRVHSSSL
jgi:hypothetical protein